MIRKERDHLISLLNRCNSSMERRAEAIKSYFSADLKRSQLREARSQRLLRDIKPQLEEAQRRAAEAETSRESTAQRTSKRINELEEEVQRLNQSLNFRRDDEIQNLEVQLSNEKSKFSRLDAEHKLLRKELTKSEVRNKALVRDISKLQVLFTPSFLSFLFIDLSFSLPLSSLSSLSICPFYSLFRLYLFVCYDSLWRKSLYFSS